MLYNIETKMQYKKVNILKVQIVIVSIKCICSPIKGFYKMLHILL